MPFPYIVYNVCCGMPQNLSEIMRLPCSDRGQLHKELLTEIQHIPRTSGHGCLFPAHCEDHNIGHPLAQRPHMAGRLIL